MNQTAETFFRDLKKADDVISLELLLNSFLDKSDAEHAENNALDTFYIVWDWYSCGTEDVLWEHFANFRFSPDAIEIAKNFISKYVGIDAAANYSESAQKLAPIIDPQNPNTLDYANPKEIDALSSYYGGLVEQDAPEILNGLKQLLLDNAENISDYLDSTEESRRAEKEQLKATKQLHKSMNEPVIINNSFNIFFDKLKSCDDNYLEFLLIKFFSEIYDNISESEILTVFAEIYNWFDAGVEDGMWQHFEGFRGTPETIALTEKTIRKYIGNEPADNYRDAYEKLTPLLNDVSADPDEINRLSAVYDDNVEQYRLDILHGLKQLVLDNTESISRTVLGTD